MTLRVPAGILTWAEAQDFAPAPPDLNPLCVWGTHKAPFTGLLVLITTGGHSTLLPTLPLPLVWGPKGASGAPAFNPQVRGKRRAWLLFKFKKRISENWTCMGAEQ